MLRKRENENFTIKQLQREIEQLNQTIELKDREIEDIKTESANQFKLICEIAQDNFSALVGDLAIDKTNSKTKIIELSTPAKVR